MAGQGGRGGAYIDMIDENGEPYRMTEKQRAFVDEYLANGYLQKEAYRKVYNYTGDRESTLAAKLFRDENVKKYLNIRRKEIFEEAHIDAMRVLQELASIGFAVKGDDIYTASHKIQALDKMAKCLGMYDVKPEKQDTTIVVKLED